MFSIIIPVYNSAHKLSRSIDSVLKQTFQNFEVIIVDDGSTDNVSEVISNIEDSRLRYIYKINGGPASARNLGIECANYKYVCLLDADDEYFYDKLEKSHIVLKENPCIDLLFTNAKYINEENNTSYLFSETTTVYKKNFYKKLLENNFIVNSTVIINKERLTEFGLFFDEGESFKFVEDYDLWLRLASKKALFYYQKDILTKYYLHGSNNSKNSIKTYTSLISVLKKHLKGHPKLIIKLILIRLKILIKSTQINLR